MHAQYTAFVLTPPEQLATRDLMTALVCVAIERPLRSELRVPGVADADVVCAESQRRKWQVGR